MYMCVCVCICVCISLALSCTLTLTPHSLTHSLTHSLSSIATTGSSSDFLISLSDALVQREIVYAKRRRGTLRTHGSSGSSDSSGGSGSNSSTNSDSIWSAEALRMCLQAQPTGNLKSSHLLEFAHFSSMSPPPTNATTTTTATATATAATTAIEATLLKNRDFSNLRQRNDSAIFSVQGLDAVQVSYQAPWPLGAFFTETHMEHVGQATRRLLELGQLTALIRLAWVQVRGLRHYWGTCHHRFTDGRASAAAAAGSSSSSVVTAPMLPLITGVKVDIIVMQNCINATFHYVQSTVRAISCYHSDLLRILQLELKERLLYGLQDGCAGVKHALDAFAFQLPQVLFVHASTATATATATRTHMAYMDPCLESFKRTLSELLQLSRYALALVSELADRTQYTGAGNGGGRGNGSGNGGSAGMYGNDIVGGSPSPSPASASAPAPAPADNAFTEHEMRERMQDLQKCTQQFQDLRSSLCRAARGVQTVDDKARAEKLLMYLDSR